MIIIQENNDKKYYELISDSSMSLAYNQIKDIILKLRYLESINPGVMAIYDSTSNFNSKKDFDAYMDVNHSSEQYSYINIVKESNLNIYFDYRTQTFQTNKTLHSSSPIKFNLNISKKSQVHSLIKELVEGTKPELEKKDVDVIDEDKFSEFKSVIESSLIKRFKNKYAKDTKLLLSLNTLDDEELAKNMINDHTVRMQFTNVEIASCIFRSVDFVNFNKYNRNIFSYPNEAEINKRLRFLTDYLKEENLTNDEIIEINKIFES